jgi:hypothetical protein
MAVFGSASSKVSCDAEFSKWECDEQESSCKCIESRTERLKPNMLRTPSSTNISPTESSMDKPIRGETTKLNAMIAVPTTKIVSVCPAPHKAPT